MAFACCGSLCRDRCSLDEEGSLDFGVKQRNPYVLSLGYTPTSMDIRFGHQDSPFANPYHQDKYGFNSRSAFHQFGHEVHYNANEDKIDHFNNSYTEGENITTENNTESLLLNPDSSLFREASGEGLELNSRTIGLALQFYKTILYKPVQCRIKWNDEVYEGRYMFFYERHPKFCVSLFPNEERDHSVVSTLSNNADSDILALRGKSPAAIYSASPRLVVSPIARHQTSAGHRGHHGGGGEKWPMSGNTLSSNNTLSNNSENFQPSKACSLLKSLVGKNSGKKHGVSMLTNNTVIIGGNLDPSSNRNLVSGTSNGKLLEDGNSILSEGAHRMDNMAEGTFGSLKADFAEVTIRWKWKWNLRDIKVTSEKNVVTVKNNRESLEFIEESEELARLLRNSLRTLQLAWIHDSLAVYSIAEQVYVC